MADGPVIQRASDRALRHGVSLDRVLAFVREFRTTNQTTPVVLMGYANPIEAMGAARFVEQAQQAGVTARWWSTTRRRSASPSPVSCAAAAWT